MEASVKWGFKYNTVTAVNCTLFFFCEIKYCGSVRNDTFYFVLSKRGLWRHLWVPVDFNSQINNSREMAEMFCCLSNATEGKLCLCVCACGGGRQTVNYTRDYRKGLCLQHLLLHIFGQCMFP